MKIVFLDGYSIGSTSLAEIMTLGTVVVYDYTASNQVIERSLGAQVIITNKVRIMAPEMDALPDLKLICVAATGTNNVDCQYAAQRKIAVRNVPAYSTDSVAEATFGLALTLLRNVIYYDRYVKDGSYVGSDRPFNLEKSISQIRGKCWGIIGMGNIGRRVAELATAFGAQVCYYSTSGANLSAGYESVTLGGLLSKADIVSVHAPLNNTTLNLINSSEFAQMKPGSIIINVGRGGIINEAALAEALNKGMIAGAGIDVFTAEPIATDNPILTILDKDRLVLAPHSAWSSEEAREVLVAKIAANIRDFFA